MNVIDLNVQLLDLALLLSAEYPDAPLHFVRHGTTQNPVTAWTPNPFTGPKQCLQNVEKGRMIVSNSLSKNSGAQQKCKMSRPIGLKSVRLASVIKCPQRRWGKNITLFSKNTLQFACT